MRPRGRAGTGWWVEGGGNGTPQVRVLIVGQTGGSSERALEAAGYSTRVTALTGAIEGELAWADVVLVLDAQGAAEAPRCIRDVVHDGPRPPAVLLLHGGTSGGRLEALTSGFDDVLTLPIDDSELCARVALFVTRHAGDRARFAEGQRLRAAHERKGDLAALVVHDMRNPLSALAGNLEMMNEALADAPADVREMLTECRELAGRSLELLSSILDVTELEEGLLRAKPVEVALEVLLTRSVRGSVAPARGRGVAIRIESESEGLTGKLDPDLTGRVLENLVSNAVRYTPPGGEIVVGARRIEQGVMFTVANGGQRIPDEERRRIFAKYYRIEERRAGARENRGLGLYFCKLAIDAHGGTITLAERPGFPVVFEVRLPQA